MEKKTSEEELAGKIVDVAEVRLFSVFFRNSDERAREMKRRREHKIQRIQLTKCFAGATQDRRQEGQEGTFVNFLAIFSDYLT